VIIFKEVIIISVVVVLTLLQCSMKQACGSSVRPVGYCFCRIFSWK